MVAYHTPKVYRSPLGCCICKAKSSSSRFTDSIRYEADFSACFKLDKPRYGEICNACVLLIKRWKKLPAGTKRNWHHVVDARARPRGRGTTKPEGGPVSIHDPMSALEKFSKLKISKHRYAHKKQRPGSPTESEDQFGDDVMSEASGASVPSSRAPSPSPSPSPFHSEDEIPHAKSGAARRKQEMPLRSNYKYYRYEDFIDYNYWKKVPICCGYVHYNEKFDMIFIDPSVFKPCCTPELAPLELLQKTSGANFRSRTSDTNLLQRTSDAELLQRTSGTEEGSESDGWSMCGDESLDGDADFTREQLNTEPETTGDAEESLLSQLAAALCTTT